MLLAVMEVYKVMKSLLTNSLIMEGFMEKMMHAFVKQIWCYELEVSSSTGESTSSGTWTLLNYIYSFINGKSICCQGVLVALSGTVPFS